MKMFITILFLISATWLAPVQAKLYRWVGEDGKVYYSDKVPPEAAKQEQKVLDERGFTLETKAAAKTPEEIAREAELERRRQEQQRLAEEQREKDQVLLRTFRNEDDIIMARNGKLSSLDAQIQIIRSNIRRLKARLEEKQSSAAQLELGGKRIPDNLRKQLDMSRSEIRTGYEQVIKQEQNKQEIREIYAKDLARFRDLKKLSSENQPALVAEKPQTSILETLVLCTQNCEPLWKEAETYVRTHATTRMQLLGDNIIMTRSPLNDSDISLTVSRSKKGDTQEMFLDVQCKDSTPGQELCNSAKVEAIRSGFTSLGQPAPTSPQ